MKGLQRADVLAVLFLFCLIAGIVAVSVGSRVVAFFCLISALVLLFKSVGAVIREGKGGE